MRDLQEIAEAAAFLRDRLGGAERAATAIVLGTGLGAVSETLRDAAAVPYDQIPHFPTLGVSGHGSRLLAGRLGGRPVLVLEGRAHAYERGDAGAMRVPIGALAALGIERLLLTCAAGSLRPALPPSSLVSIADHINLSGLNPLIGETDERRFVPMADAYDPALRLRLAAAAAEAGVPLGEGVYAWFSGPNFETAAEIRMADRLGADLVGMSTVPEVILARFHGLAVAAIGVVTNMATGVGLAVHTHRDTKDVAAGAAPALARLLSAFAARCSEQ